METLQFTQLLFLPDNTVGCRAELAFDNNSGGKDYVRFDVQVPSANKTIEEIQNEVKVRIVTLLEAV